METNVFEGKGIILEKQEKAKATGDKYWRFKVKVTQKEKQKTDETLTFSLWEYPAGHDVSVNDKVEIFWTEKDGGLNQHGAKVTYRNLNSIASIAKDAVPSVQGSITNNVPVEKVEAVMSPGELHNRKQDEILFGQVLNLSFQWIMNERRIEQSPAVTFDENFDKVFKHFYEKAEEKRKEKLGR